MMNYLYYFPCVIILTLVTLSSSIFVKLENTLRVPENVRYLILDRTCYSLRGIELRYMSNRTIILEAPNNVDPRITSRKQCWMEIPQSGVLPREIWNNEGDVKMLIHGFNFNIVPIAHAGVKEHNMFLLGEEYGRDIKSHNVIAVDWTSPATSAYYPIPAFNTRLVGRQVAIFLKNLIDNVEMRLVNPWKNVHLIGFSLGAHVAGVAGYHLQNLFGVKLGRITGLDPAGPHFDLPGGFIPLDVSGFLEKSDAEFVDVIHCNMGIALTALSAVIIGKYGSSVQSGHADFYPNGGESQPPVCNYTTDTVACSHMTCTRYFIHSIMKAQYMACRCESWIHYLLGACRCTNDGVNGVLMGEHCSKTAYGRYYVLTVPPAP